jgi:protein-S-isoprenylcysteine O-methyltransferase Ste14
MSHLFLLSLLVGFSCNLASACTTVFSRKLGERGVWLVTVILRNVLGIPLWGLGFALAAVADSPLLMSPTPVSLAAGWAMIAAGAALILTALATIRLRAAAPTVRDSLAENGIYARLRHPIHDGTILEFLGIMLVRPSASISLACALGLAWILLQTRIEEWDLQQRIPGYREYMRRVPRFLPRWKP